MGRVFLAVWLALFAVQASDLVAAVAPDGCVEESSADPCPERCARCVCCTRVPLCVPLIALVISAEAMTEIATVPPREFVSSADPHGILHVPKTL
jgi:hypothetical protein